MLSDMHALTSMILFQTLTAPIQQATWPAQVTTVEDGASPRRMDYQWEDARTFYGNQVDDPNRFRLKWELDAEGRFLRASASRDGGPFRADLEYEYAGGLPVRGREGRKALAFHYSGARLDSISRKVNDTLVGYLKYAYDGQGRLSQVDDLYDLNGEDGPRHRRYAIRYFLPDSIVEEYRYLDNPEEHGHTVCHLQGDLPIRKVDTDHWFEEKTVLVTTWTYAGTSSVRPSRGEPNRRFVIGFLDLLGRNRGGRPATPACRGKLLLP